MNLEPKASYKRRLAYCLEKAQTDKQNSMYWLQAVSIYKHLIECELSHTVKNDGKEKCSFSYFPDDNIGMNKHQPRLSTK